MLTDILLPECCHSCALLCREPPTPTRLTGKVLPFDVGFALPLCSVARYVLGTDDGDHQGLGV